MIKNKILNILKLSFFVVCFLLLGNVVKIQAADEEIAFIETEKEQYIFKNNGYVDALCINGVTKDGIRLELTGKAECFSENENIVSVYEGMIRAEGRGETFIVVNYQGIQLRIPVYVENEVDLDALEEKLLLRAGCGLADNSEYIRVLQNTSTKATASGSRTTEEILAKAVAMKNVKWTPKKRLADWRNDEPFEAGVEQQGIPYTQNIQADEVKFIYYMNNDDTFYDVATVQWWNAAKQKMEDISCPKYGVDCSGYVSYALAITRCSSGQMVDNLQNGTGQIVKAGAYDPNKLTETALLGAYKELQPGYALARRGHAILVLYNDVSEKEIVVYETVNRLPKISTYSYNVLWSERYLPFKRAQ